MHLCLLYIKAYTTSPECACMCVCASPRWFCSKTPSLALFFEYAFSAAFSELTVLCKAVSVEREKRSTVADSKTEHEALEAGEEEDSRCSSESVTMPHGEVVLTNTPWRPGPVAAISVAPFSASHPSKTCTYPDTHTHHHTTNTTTLTVLSPAPAPQPLSPLLPGLPLMQPQPNTPPYADHA